MELEKSRSAVNAVGAPTALATLAPIQSAAQFEAKKQLDKFEAERKASDEKKKMQEIESKKEAERKALIAKQAKEEELKKKADAEKQLSEQKKEADLKNQSEQIAKRKEFIDTKS